MSVLTAAVVQLCSTADVAHNLERVAALCQRAQARGAELIVLPENFALLSPDENDKFAWAVRMVQSDAGVTGEGKILDRMRELARTLGVHLVLGGLPEAGRSPGKVWNSSVHIGPDGNLAAVYRKIHLFDVHFAQAATSLREVAQRAGVSERSLYQHFATKVVLFQRVVEVGIVGDVGAEPMTERPWSRAAVTAPTLADRVEVRLVEVAPLAGAMRQS